MPYIQRATANYFGFMPAQADATLVPVNAYTVSSSEANAINAGDVVMLTTDKETARRVTGTFAGTILGVAANSIAAGAGSTGATINVNTSQLLYVYDDPDQVFAVSCSSSGILAAAAIGQRVPVISTGPAGTSPSALLLRSNQVIGIGSTSAGAFTVLGLHPIENGDYSSAAGGAATVTADVRKYLVKPNVHYFGVAASTGHVTT